MAIDQGTDEDVIGRVVLADGRVPVVERKLVGLALDHIDLRAPEGAQLAHTTVVVKTAVVDLATGQTQESVVTTIGFIKGRAVGSVVDFFRPGVGAVPGGGSRLRQWGQGGLRIVVRVVSNRLVEYGEAKALTHVVEARRGGQQGEVGGKTRVATRVEVAVEATAGGGADVPQVGQDAFVAMHVDLLGREGVGRWQGRKIRDCPIARGIGNRRAHQVGAGVVVQVNQRFG